MEVVFTQCFINSLCSRKIAISTVNASIEYQEMSSLKHMPVSEL